MKRAGLGRILRILWYLTYLVIVSAILIFVAIVMVSKVIKYHDPEKETLADTLVEYLAASGKRMAEPVLDLKCTEEGRVVSRKVFLSEYIKEKRIFHSLIEAGNPLWDRFSSCLLCHGALDHKGEEKMVASVLNMHSTFFTCLACHMKKGEEKVTYSWILPDWHEAPPPYPGTGYNEKGILSMENAGRVKLAPFLVRAGKKTPLKEDEGIGSAKGYLVDEGEGRVIPRRELTVFHDMLSPVGTGCYDCHRTESAIDFYGAGFSMKRVNELSTMTFQKVIEGEEKIYIPTIFR